MKQIIAIGGSLIAGFIGGILGARLTHTVERSVADGVVRARSFELVDKTGKAIAFWGVDKMGYTVLAFRGTESVSGSEPDGAQRSTGLDDPQNQRTAIGIMADSPFLEFRAPDGAVRMDLWLTAFQKPLLLMKDETGPRVRLGINHSDTPSFADNNWVLSFEPDRASIGIFSRAEGGQDYVTGFSSISKDKRKFP